MEQVTKYVAADGKEFFTEAECRAYEAVIEFKDVVGLRPSQIITVLAGEDRALGDVIEKLAGKIARKRIEMGGSKRARKTTAESAT